MTTCLISGGAGFIGSHYVDFLLRKTDWEVVVWDCLNYSSLDAWRLREIGAFSSTRFRFHNLDIASSPFPEMKPQYLVHLAAETHVDRSIVDAEPFISSNVVGTYKLMEWSRTLPSLQKFLMFSTDEVFGPSDGSAFSEWSVHNPSNPYAATKSAAENLAMAWANTYSLPVIVSHCSNVFGKMQDCEKFIPKLVKAIRGGHNVTIHANENGQSGLRMYVHVGDVAKAIQLMITKGKNGEKYNITGQEISNEEMAHTVALILEKNLISQKTYPYKERPGWDFSYRIKGANLRALGWEPTDKFVDLLRQTVESIK